MDTITELTLPYGRRKRRNHSSEFKAAMVAACQQPGVSMAAVALANGLNANVLRRWVVQSEQGTQPAAQGLPVPRPASAAAAFVALPMAPPLPPQPQHIRIDLSSGGVTLHWPITQRHELSQWLKDWLR